MLTCRGGAVKLAVSWPEVIVAVNDGTRSPAAVTLTLAAVIRSGPARPSSCTCPDGWLRITAVRAGTVSR